MVLWWLVLVGVRVGNRGNRLAQESAELLPSCSGRHRHHKEIPRPGTEILNNVAVMAAIKSQKSISVKTSTTINLLMDEMREGLLIPIVIRVSIGIEEALNCPKPHVVI